MRFIFNYFSAIVLAYNICGHKRKGKYNPFNYIKYLINRWLSITRKIIGPILLLYLLPLFGEGPIWHYFEQLHVKPCKQYLMQTLFFYNNYMNGFDKIVSFDIYFIWISESWPFQRTAKCNTFIAAIALRYAKQNFSIQKHW